MRELPDRLARDLPFAELTAKGSQPQAISLRVASAGDEPFLFNVYASTRAAELALVDWDDEQKRTFLTMQYRAQDTHYRNHFPGASFDVIEASGEAAGRLYVDRGDDEIRILDIALLPEYCGSGIGTTLLSALQAEAESNRKVLILHVEQHNPAHNLYLRLGFVPVGQQGIHVKMQWTPSIASHK